MWELIAEIKRCEAAGAITAAVAMAFVCIDTMAFLSLPPEKDKQRRVDFIDWVDAYLKGHEDQPYQYRGLDVYGARCALLHAFGSEGDYHQQCPDAKKFGYHDGGKHAYDPAQDEHLVIIGTASFLNDVVHGVGAFCEACKADPELRARVESRLPKVLAAFSMKAMAANAADKCQAKGDRADGRVRSAGPKLLIDTAPSDLDVLQTIRIAQKRGGGDAVVSISHGSQRNLAISVGEQRGTDDRLAGQEDKAPVIFPKTK